jgi:sporulation protein YlmC with PRC-barrel domain
LSTFMVGPAHRKRITRKIESYVEVEVNYVQAVFHSTVSRESSSAQDGVSSTVPPF